MVQVGMQVLSGGSCDTFLGMEQVKKGPGRPATGQVPVRTVRVGAIWDEAYALAKNRGDRMPDLIEQALRRYVARHKG